MRKLIAVFNSIFTQLVHSLPEHDSTPLSKQGACLAICQLSILSPDQLTDYRAATLCLPTWNPSENAIANFQRLFPFCPERAVVFLFVDPNTTTHVACVREWKGHTVLVDTNLTQVPLLWPGNQMETVIAALNQLYPSSIRRAVYNVPGTPPLTDLPGPV